MENGRLEPAGENDPVVERFLADPVVQGKINNMAPLAQIEMGKFDPVFLPGGHGTMWDLPLDASVRHTVEQAFNADKVVAAVCHGPAGLVPALRADGRSILHGKRVTGFSNTEEQAVGLAEVVPFLLESRMRELGGDYHSGPDWQPFAQQDGKLITGQNPASSHLVGQAVLAALGVSAG